MDNIYFEIQKYMEQLQNRIEFLESIRKGAPSENLHFRKRGDRIYFFERSSGVKRKQKYIHSNDFDRIQVLANKKYFSMILPTLYTNLEAAKRFLNSHTSYSEDDIAENIIPEIMEYNKNIYIPKTKLIEAWQNESYTRNSFHPESLIHDTLRGDMMRSKSEVIIADALFRNSICYKPEYPVKLRHGYAYPDFTIIHPETLKIYYWEHFGMMDNPEYANDACRKIKEYAESGILQGENLICSFESSDVPLSSTHVKHLIDNFFFV